jgi:hypothetical protein
MTPNMRFVLHLLQDSFALALSAVGAGVPAIGVLTTVGAGSPSGGAGGGALAVCSVCAAALETAATKASSPAPDETTTLFILETEITLALR